MNSTKWSRPAQQSERVAYLQAALRVLRSTHTHIWACMHTNTQSKECQFQFVLHSQEEDEGSVCVWRLCRMSEVIEMLHILSCTGGIIGPCSLMALPSTSIHLTATHSTTNTETNWCTHLRVCVYAFITYFVGMCVFAITQWEEHQLLSIKTLALKKLLHFKLQT